MGEKRAPRVILTPADRAELRRVAFDPNQTEGAALRSTAMLMAAEPGMTTNEVARRVGVPVESVRKWQETLHDEGVHELTGPKSAAAIRNHPWAGIPSKRVAMLAAILREQTAVIRDRFRSLEKTWIDHCSDSDHFLRYASGTAGKADYNGAAPINGPRYTPTNSQATLGAPAAKVIPQPSRVIIRELTEAGWKMRREGKGSHSIWEGPDGRRTLAVPDGHQMISTGVVHKIRQAIANYKS